MEQAARYVLLVDDEQNILLSLKRELHEWARGRGLTILASLSAKEGLTQLDAHGTDVVLVVSDLRMPEMKGSDFLLEVRKRYPDMITMLLTGYSETEEIVKAVRSGIFSFMLKPWDSEYLLSEFEKAWNVYRSKAENAEYKKHLEEELKWAGELQRVLLRPQLPASDRIECRVTYRPVQGLYCGGDYYDVIRLGNTHYVVLIGDVAGHGVRAAFVTGILKAVIYPEYMRNLGGKRFSPSAFLSWLNDRMQFEFRSTDPMLITFFAGLIDLDSMGFQYANAGHTHPFLMNAGKVVEMPVSGTALGFGRSTLYTEQVVPLVKGNTLFFFTDGLSEANPAVRMEEILAPLASGNDFHHGVIEKTLASAGVDRFADDVTIVTAKVL